MTSLSKFGTNNRWNRMRGTSIKTYSVNIWYSVLTIQRLIAIDPLGLCRQIQEWGQYTLLSSLGSRVFEDSKFKKSSTEQYFQTYPENLEQRWGHWGRGGRGLPPFWAVPKSGYPFQRKYFSLRYVFGGKITWMGYNFWRNFPGWPFHQQIDELLHSIKSNSAAFQCHNNLLTHWIFW